MDRSGRDFILDLLEKKIIIFERVLKNGRQVFKKRDDRERSYVS